MPLPVQSQDRDLHTRVDRHASTFLVCFVLVAVTVLLYAKVGRYDFVEIDDHEHVYENQHVLTGLTLPNIAWAFGIHGPGQWHPLAWLSHQLTCQLFGLNAGAHHLINLCFHTASVVILLLALKRMTGALWASAFVAALFALHPLHVESVAWICERRDVMYAFFWMLTLWAYVSYAQRGGVGRYVLVVLGVASSLMSKPMAVTLPCVLMLLDYWPLSRHVATNGDAQADGGDPSQRTGQVRSIRFLALEKVPLLVMSLGAGILTILSHTFALAPLEAFSIPARLATAALGYVTYIRKLVWPADLAVFYPHSTILGSDTFSSLYGPAIAAGLLLLIITFFMVLLAENRRYLIIGWLWYVGTLVPVSGLFQAGDQALADRFTYLPMIGIYILVAWSARDLAMRSRTWRIGLSVAVPFVIGVLTTVTWHQIGHWQKSQTLFEHAIKVTTGNYVAHQALGSVLAKDGKLNEAAFHHEQAIQIHPRYAQARFNYAVLLEEQGKIDFAESQYIQAVAIKPDFAKAHNNLGILLSRKGQLGRAEHHLRYALRLEPNYAQARNNLGFLSERKGNLQEAAVQFERAIQLDSDVAQFHKNLGLVYVKLGKLNEAADQLKRAISIDPSDPELHYGMARVLGQQNDLAGAAVHFERALQLKPNFTDAHFNLGVVFARQQRWNQALSQFRSAAGIDPDFSPAHYNIGLVLLNLGKPDQAERHFREALRIDPGYEAAQASLRRARALIERE